ncbi:MAG: sigma-70 family RNA polymerase sigma factor [Myxococcota bacterium]
MPDESQDDEELLRQWRDGDKAAGDRLVRRHVGLLYRFFRSRAAEHTADLAQKTFLAAVEARDRVPEDAGFRPYLLGIARNQFLMFIRTNARRPRADAPADSRLMGEGPTPSGAVALREEQKTLLRALRKLPFDMQLCIELFYWEGLSRNEIAHVLDAEVNTVKSRLQRAKARLREIMIELEPASSTMTVDDLGAWASSLRKHMSD